MAGYAVPMVVMMAFGVEAVTSVSLSDLICRATTLESATGLLLPQPICLDKDDAETAEIVLQTTWLPARHGRHVP